MNMPAPLLAGIFAVAGGLFLALSAFLGVTALADWTMLAAESCFVLAAVVFLGWFFIACVQEIRNA
jgi:uncharacterized membrane protein